ncbi:MAG: glycoside hydrolase family 5 protein [Bacteroidetes bacterium]|nr:glycoside hydrolase family 5 protein [Bacteroidota bacterium]
MADNGNFNETNGAYWIEFPQGTYNTTMATFLKDLLKLCSERGIYLIINPFDTYYYDDYFSRTPWASANGGPLDSINDFFTSSSPLAMCKARWYWVISQILSSGYEDAVLGYEILNEWDSWEWTIADADINKDAALRVTFLRELTEYIRTLDGQRMIFSPTTALDPRAALADFGYYSDLFDASLPHLYFPGSREPWNNPATYADTAVLEEQARAISWFTTNQLHNKPVLNGEWGPADEWMPDPSNPSYFSSFQEADD